MTGRTKVIVAQNSAEIVRAIGLIGANSEEWKVQHALLKRLQQIVGREGLTHAEVARRGGSSRTRVKAMLNGNPDKVSSDLIIRLLGALGYRVKVSVFREEIAA